MSEKFTWVSVHKAIAEEVRKYRKRQKELIRILIDTGINGVKDRDKDGNDIELDEIDPFSFFCFIYKHGDKKRLEYLQKIASHFGLEKPVDTSGIPSVNAQKVMLFPFQFERDEQDINVLWDIFEASFNDTITEELYTRVLRVKGTAQTIFTEALFNVDPEKYLAINKITRPYLQKVIGVSPKFKSYGEYQEMLENVRQKDNRPYYQISHDAWLWSNEKADINYWIFQRSPQMFDLKQALLEGNLELLTVKSHKDKIRAGDKIILWASGNKSGCYGLAEAKSEAYEAEMEQAGDNLISDVKTDIVVDFEVTHNLANDPLLKDEIESIPVLKNLKIGYEGGVFSATQSQFEKLKELAENKIIRTWLYSPGELASRWDEFYDKGIVAVSKSEMGDLTAFRSKNEIYSKLKQLFSTDISKRNDATALYDFCRVMRPGDIVIVKKGTKQLLGYGIVLSEYYFDNTAENMRHRRKVNWKKRGVWESDHTLVTKSLTNITDYPEDHEEYKNYSERLLRLMDVTEIKTNGRKPEVKHKSVDTGPLNRILYGPPGTGKTYHTVNHALSVIEGKTLENLKIEEKEAGRASLVGRFQKYRDDGRVVFVTFHQSMSYEDFIEGIKPEVPELEEELEEDGDPGTEFGITYSVKPGIFKKLCRKAETSVRAAHNFDELWRQFIDHLMNEKEVIFQSTESKLRLIHQRSSPNSLKVRFLKTTDDSGSEGKLDFTVTNNLIRKLFDAGVDVSPGAHNKWIQVRDTVGAGRSTLALAVYKKFWEFLDSIGALTDRDSLLPHVIVIDEINRGNIAQIFGELITLIETDKRSGMQEAITVTLPYSKDSFSVPHNVYIIGTMNTADRSVEALDTALRRRFSFIEVRPDVDLIRTEGKLNGRGSLLKVGGSEFDLSEILDVINQRIEKLIDKDHQIGHSYFLNVASVRDLAEIFRKNIIPLLEEYFYGDKGKIQLVLGKGIIEQKNNDVHFADSDDGITDLYEDRPVWSLVTDWHTDSGAFEKALNTLLRKQNG